MGGIPLVVLVAEKSKFLEPYKVEAVLKRAVDSITPAGGEVSLVVYSSRALPLLDPTPDAPRILEAYEEAPILPGAPEPSLALREAGELVAHYRDSLTGPVVVVLLWSTKSRPRRALRVAEFYLAALGARLVVVLLSPKRRPWAQKFFPHAASILYSDPPARIGRIGEALSRALEAGEE